MDVAPAGSLRGLPPGDAEAPPYGKGRSSSADTPQDAPFLTPRELPQGTPGAAARPQAVGGARGRDLRVRRPPAAAAAAGRGHLPLHDDPAAGGPPAFDQRDREGRGPRPGAVRD